MNSINVFGASTKSCFGKIGTFITEPKVHQKIERGFSRGISKFYGGIKSVSNKALSGLENQGFLALKAPVAQLQNMRAIPVAIDDTMSSGKKNIYTTLNQLTNYHVNVIKSSEKVSRIAGEKVAGAVRLLLTPIRFGAKIIRMEALGGMIQNSVALAIGFVMRFTIFIAMQIGHFLPYLAIGAGSGAIGIAIATLAIKLSPLAAAGTGLALLITAQQVKIHTLGKEVAQLNHQLDQFKHSIAKNSANSLKNRLKIALSPIARHKGKMITTLALGAAAAFGFYRKESIVESVGPHVETALGYLENTEAYQVMSVYAKNTVDYVLESAAFAKVSEYAKDVVDYAFECTDAVTGKFHEMVS